MRTHFLQGALRVEYRVQLQTLGENSSLIVSERRIAGGNGGAPALALAHLGARVHLSGNAIGDDSHGKFLMAQLQHPNLELNIEVSSEVATPYAILIRAQNGETQTLLSPEAAQLDGAQDYPALLESLKNALLEWRGEGDEIERLERVYDHSFGDFTLLRLDGC